MFHQDNKLKQLTQLQSKDLPELRKSLLDLQNNKCAICHKDLGDDVKNQHVDHQHCTKQEEIGYNGAGLIRGVLCRACNALEGKIWNNTKRYGVVDPDNPVSSRIEFLENLILYYKENTSTEPDSLYYGLIHPREKRVHRMSKTDYNALKQWFEDQPENIKHSGEPKPFPKFTGKWTPKFLEILQNFEKSA